MSWTHGGLGRAWRLVLCAGLLSSGACDSCHSSSGTAAPEEAPAPVERPEDARAELHFRGGTHFLNALREQAGRGVAAATAPRSAGDLLGRLTTLPEDLEARVVDDSPIEGLLLGEGDNPHRVYAARLQLEDSREHPLGAERALGAALGTDAHWVNAAEEPAMALSGDVLVVSDARASVEQALPWLATRALGEERPAGVAVVLLPGVVSRAFLSMASAAVDRWVADARRNLETERSRHDQAPEVADPEAALRLAEARARAMVALLPDVGEVSVTITSEAAGPTLNVHAVMTPDSPLAQKLATYHAFGTASLARLPTSAALRLIAASQPPDAEGDSVLLSLLGDRLGPEERSALEQIGLALHDGSGPWALSAGIDGGRSFVAFFGHSQTATDVPAAMRTAMGAQWLGQGLSLGLGCENRPPRVSESGDLLRLGGCTGDTTRELLMARSGATRGLLAARTDDVDANAEQARSMTATFAGEGAASALDPASQRLLAALPAQSVVALLTDPAQVAPSVAGLLRTAELAAGAATPIALAVSIAPDAVDLRLILAPGAASNLANIGIGLAR